MENKISISDLSIEITRRCNMICEHCLRGNAQKINIKEEYIENVLKQCDMISNVTFSGGEPSLYVKAIEQFISLVNKYKIQIGSFYIATNGKKIKEDFLVAVCKLYAMCDEPEMCAIEISKDVFHKENEDTNPILLNALSFVRYRNEDDDYYDDWRNEGLYNYNFGVGIDNEKEEFIIEDNYISEGNLYLNAKGQIIAGGNWSYKSQRKHMICNSNDNILENIQKYIGNENDSE